MPVETLLPDSLLDQVNLAGTVSEIDDDPDGLDNLWLTAGSGSVSTVCHVSFPTPIVVPPAGADLQLFRIWVRRTNNSARVPSLDLELYENGALLSTLLNNVAVNSVTGELLTAAWDASLLTDPTGAGVELRVVGNVSGGPVAQRNTIEIGAVIWVSGAHASTWHPIITIGGGETVFSVLYDDVLIRGYTPIDEDNLLAIPYREVEAIRFVNNGTDTWYATYTQLRGQAGEKFFDQTITPSMNTTIDIPAPQRPMTFEENYMVSRVG